MGDIDGAAIAASLLTTVKGQIEGAAAGFLSTHKDVESFLLTATARLGKAMLLHWVEKDADRLALLEEEIEDERAAILEESDAVLKEIQDSAAPLVLTILKTFFSTAAAVAPLAAKFI